MKSFLSLSILLVALTFCVCAWKSAPTSPAANAAVKDSATIPPAVHTIMQNSCFACHGANGKGMALSHVKMEEWGSYSADKQASKAAAICKVATAGKMPPKGFLKEHPNAALTQEQIAVLCKWSEDLNKGK
jgi:mono/diheme cytochrome c family protein